MIKIKGFQTLTLLDYPGRIAATVFTQGCNFRCPFCHNASLVVGFDKGEYIASKSVLSHLEKRKGKLSGLCISGGEPLLQKELPDFIKCVKALGYKVKLDTNGSLPNSLLSLLEAGLLDYVAMDIKNSREKYLITSGIETLINDDMLLLNIQKSIDILRSWGVPFEFRTTVVRELHSLDDIKQIGEWLAGDELFFLQNFVDSGDLISSGLTACTNDEMEGMCKCLKRFLPNVAIRGK